MNRRAFIRNTATVAAVAGLGYRAERAEGAGNAAEPASREYYEWRAYRLKAGASSEVLDGYLEKAAIPAWNRLGIKPVGVFTEADSKAAPVVYVLLPHPSLESFATAWARLEADAAYQAAGADYLKAPVSRPAFDRVDSWLMLAFAGMPKLELPAYSAERKPRVFELRTYESHSESKALKKVEMFNAGEIAAMREVGLAPVFYGQALSGADLPHLTYMLSGEDRQKHQQHWNAFNRHPTWVKLNGDRQYADTVSKISNRFLVPAACSQV